MQQPETVQGKWILVDMLNSDQFGLLSIGHVNYSGASLRKNLDPLARELLIDRIRKVHDSAQSLDDEISARGSQWQVRVEPVLSPINRCVIAALAIFVPAGDEIPDPPPVGGIEWKIMDGGARIETVWDDNMFRLYGITRGGEGSATGDMAQWVNSLIAPEDRARMKVVIDGGIAAPDGQRHLVAYRIITGADTDSPGSKHLEASGRVFFDDENPVKWLRSITREVSELSPAQAPTNVDMASGSLLRAAFELAQDEVMIAVDTNWWQTYMTSPTWTAFQLRTPRYGYLPHVIHPDDIAGFRNICEMGRASSAPALVRFLQTDGTYSRYEVSASNGHFDASEHQRYVIVTLRKPRTE